LPPNREIALKAIRAAQEGLSQRDPCVTLQINLDKDAVAKARTLGAESDLSWDEFVHQAVSEALLG